MSAFQYPQVPFPPQQPRRSPVPWVVAGVCALLAIVVTIVLSLMYTEANSKADEHSDKVTESAAADALRESARQAGCDFMTKFATYDFNELDKYFSTIKDGTSGQLNKQFVDGQTALRDVLIQAQTRSTSENIHCGVESINSATARVVTVGLQHISSFATPEPTTSQLAIILTLDHQSDGRWLMSAMDPVGAK